MSDRYDLVIIGAGMGGSALAWSLAGSGLSICILERGHPLKQEPENWEPDEVIANRRYDPDEVWYDGDDRPFTPRVYYFHGGSSKFFGGSAFRLRESDFRSHDFGEGPTRDWPFGYADLAPFYEAAERAMHIHGLAGSDPTEPPRGDYPHAPLEHEPPIAWLADRFRAQGLKPFPLPIAVHQGDGGHCRKGSPCDGFPCKIRAKFDGENAFLRPARRSDSSIEVVSGACVERLVADHGVPGAGGAFRADGGAREGGAAPASGPAPADRGGAHRAPLAEIRAAEVILDDGTRRTIYADRFVLAAGAVNSAALLLRSADERFPTGLANSSGQVGRNFMSHNNTVLMALAPWRDNPTRFQKTLALNDFYHDGGNVQMRGKVLPQNLRRSGTAAMRRFARQIARRSFDFWVMSEDLPDPDNRVTLRADGSIRLARRLNNLAVHDSLVRRTTAAIRRAGLPIVLCRPPSPAAIQHMVGTLRAGDDPADSVVDAECRAHDLENLWVVDGSIFPSSAAVNPALTIAANALRVGDILRGGRD